MNILQEKSTGGGKKNPGSPFILDVDTFILRMNAFGFRVARGSEIAEAVSLGERLIEGELAHCASVAKVQEFTGITVWVSGSPVDGLFLVVPLSVEGQRAVRNGTFSPAEPNRNFLAAAGELCGGLYVGVYAGVSKEVRRAIMQASAVLRVEVFGSVPCFARAATDDGARTMLNLGFRPADFGASKLYVQEALYDTKRVA